MANAITLFVFKVSCDANYLGDIVIADGVTVDSDLNGVSPQFTLTCISTGGPATTVIWTRDNATITEGTETVLDDPVTAQYTHTLTATGRLGGLYTCIVANEKPSEAIASFNAVEGAHNITLKCKNEKGTGGLFRIVYMPVNLLLWYDILT